MTRYVSRESRLKPRLRLEENRKTSLTLKDAQAAKKAQCICMRLSLYISDFKLL